MENVSSLLKEKVLKILDHLEIFLDYNDLKMSDSLNSQGNQLYKIQYSEHPQLFIQFKSKDDYTLIPKYLEKQDITFKIFNDRSLEYAQKGMHLTGSIFGTLYGDRNKLREKIKALRQKLSGTSDIKQVNHFTYYFNKTNGNLTRYPPEKNRFCKFNPQKGRYEIMIKLIDEKSATGNQYVSTAALTLAGNYSSHEKCREAVHKIRVTFQKTFNAIRGEDFIEGEYGSGYRIGGKFEIFFEDTP